MNPGGPVIGLVLAGKVSGQDELSHRDEMS
jgi:hypothetical protein